MSVVGDAARGAAAGTIGAIGSAAEQIGSIFGQNPENEAERAASSRAAALTQLASEFENQRDGWFHAVVDGLNRLPRPLMAMGVIGLFIFAMADPLGFDARMRALQAVPEPLWWLLGAVVGFYFGGRELHYRREQRSINPNAAREAADALARIENEAQARRNREAFTRLNEAGEFVADVEAVRRVNPALADLLERNAPKDPVHE